MKDIDDFKLTDRVKVRQVKDWMHKKDDASKELLIDLIYHRFFNRYIKHIQPVDSGFLKMAVACFVIETLESFKQGIENTHGKSKDMFRDFFRSEEAHFPGFNEISAEFYRDIRCGILHQGETTNAWRILRTHKLVDKENKTIHATKFVEALEKSLNNYIQHLRDQPFDSVLWKNAFIKLQDIIKNCKER